MTFSKNDSTHKVLVDPRFAIEWRDIIDFLSEFGPFNGRYIPRYPNNWDARLRERIVDLSASPFGPVQRQAILERIRRELPFCSVPVGWKYIDEQSWSTNVVDTINFLEKSIVVGDALDPKPFVPWIDALEDIRQTRKRSWPFQGTVTEYLDSCRPLLLNSPAAYLIDCYLNPFSDIADYLIRSLFAEAKGSKCYSIEIITRRAACTIKGASRNSELMTETEIELNFKRMYRYIVPKDRNLKLHLVTEAETKFGSDALRLHDRFFITIHGSINFGQGFILARQKIHQQNAFVTDKDHHGILKQTYIDGVARHRDRLPKVSGIAYPLEVVSISF